MASLIRQLMREDAESFREFRLAALRASPASFGASADEEEALPMARWEQRMLKPGSAVLGCFDDTLLVGSVGYYVSDEDKHPWLWTMYVQPSRRGRGLGRALVERAAADLRHAGHKELHLHVSWASEAARAMYRACGFRLVSLERDVPRHSGLVFDVEHLVMAL